MINTHSKISLFFMLFMIKLSGATVKGGIEYNERFDNENTVQPLVLPVI